MHLQSAKSVSTRPWSLALTALLAGVGLGLAGCGQKGPLSLPKTAPTQAASPSPAVPAGAASVPTR